MNLFTEKGLLYRNQPPEKFGLPADPSAYLKSVAHRMGYVDPKADPEMQQRIKQTIGAGLAAVRISVIAKAANLIEVDPQRVMGNGLVIDSSRWAGLIKSMQLPIKVAAFAAALGQALDQRRQDIGLFDAFVLDCMGAELTERLGNRLESDISGQFLKIGLICTRRFSPGYCDWPLDTGQAAVFQFLTPETIGITRLPTGAMIPEKSITAVLIAGKTLSYQTPCPLCKQTECPYRRENS
jgi:hypothetical protein